MKNTTPKTLKQALHRGWHVTVSRNHRSYMASFSKQGEPTRYSRDTSIRGLTKRAFWGYGA